MQRMSMIDTSRLEVDREASMVNPGDVVEATFAYEGKAWIVRGEAIAADPTKCNPTFMHVGRDTIACYGRAHHTLASVRVVKAAAPVFKVGDWVALSDDRRAEVTGAAGLLLAVRIVGQLRDTHLAASLVTLSTMPEPSKGSVVLDKNGEAWQRSTAGPGYWRSSEGTHAWDELLTSRGPVTVLHRGKSA